MEDELEAFIRMSLELDETIPFQYGTTVNDLPIMVDCRYTDECREVYMEITSRGNLRGLSHLNMIRDLLGTSYEGGRREYYFVSKGFDEGVETVANLLGIDELRVPFNIRMPRAKTLGRSVDITKEKSWRVVHALIERRESSIRALSTSTGVSYAWTHNVVQALIEKGGAERVGSLVHVKNVNKILSSIAMGRPMRKMLLSEFMVDGGSALDIARSVTAHVNQNKVRVAFTGLLSGGIHSGSGMAFDHLDAYVDPSDVGMFRSIFETPEGGVRLRIYRMDRDVFTDSVLKASIQLVSESQAMLDLAGMGRESMGMLHSIVGHDGL